MESVHAQNPQQRVHVTTMGLGMVPLAGFRAKVSYSECENVIKSAFARTSKKSSKISLPLQTPLHANFGANLSSKLCFRRKRRRFHSMSNATTSSRSQEFSIHRNRSRAFTLPGLIFGEVMSNKGGLAFPFPQTRSFASHPT